MHALVDLVNMAHHTVPFVKACGRLWLLGGCNLLALVGWKGIVVFMIGMAANMDNVFFLFI